MRALLLLLPLLAACSLTLEVAYPGHRIQALRTQGTYCADRNTLLDYRFLLEGRLDALEFFFVPEGVDPWRARPEERFRLSGPIFGPQVRGYLEVTPRGEVRAGTAVSPQGIVVEPLPDRRLWVRGVTAGVLGPYVRAQNPVRPDVTASCDPSW
ncbi:hypothetical protein [Thermus sediminis]|uniref:hypothetical protein n=1 Tax=Thermus sediminis TaxID=1761908 RepID=UPI000E3C71D7|nr:hypothetical protein [Thermus sediminis]